ncbi:MAG: hypothetical protein K1Y36_12505 [Blastocatellia bacterium]|nr:hypothetical protein [Blastocatellia bacterium]
MTENTKPEIQLKPVDGMKRLMACVAGFLAPGAGHVVLGRYGRGVLFAVCIYGMTLVGLLMNGHLYLPTDSDRLSPLFFTSDLGIGLLYPLLFLLNVGQKVQPVLTTFEYGNNFIAVAGLLNYLVVLDAFDIASGRKP